MCGFAGVLSSSGQRSDQLADALRTMSDQLQHRGPDDSGIWTEAEGHCGFGFRRLAILDLSPNGHQPMSSPTGRYVVMFNGEVYNHLNLRRELETVGFCFRGHSDTETLCAGFEHWGVRDTIRRCIGMFAIAVWDNEGKSLSLIRDRLGIKPLYVYHTSGLVLFSSEIKGLSSHPGFRKEIDARALDTFLQYLYIPAPLSIYQNLTKVAPGHILTMHLSDLAGCSEPYWSLAEVYDAGRRNPFEGSEQEGVQALEELLLDAVRIRKLSDVPLGALLSGGIDSTTVVAMMQAGASTPTRTFSIGFSAAEHDESTHAAAIAQYLGTDHKTTMLSGSESLAVLPELAHIFDEPFADPSQIPTLLVCRMAKADVTVALTGDGGDEVFGGYHRYIDGHRVITRAMRVPPLVRYGGAAVASRVASRPSAWLDRLMLLSGRRLGRQKMHKLAAILSSGSTEEMYRSLLSAWQDSSEVMSGDHHTDDPIRAALAHSSALPLLDRMMMLDQATYLPDEMLTKVDRASMAVSLEARVPLLDHRVVEFAWRIPREWKIRGRRGKWLLREVLYRHVPRELVDRPKVGFTVPIAEWLRGPLRPWAEHGLQNVGDPIDRTAVMEAWRRFQNGAPGLELGLWAVVMFQAWHDAWTN